MTNTPAHQPYGAHADFDWTAPRRVPLVPVEQTSGIEAETSGAHFCTHPADATGERGCPRWPACLNARPLLEPLAMPPLTANDVADFAERWRDASTRMVADAFGVPHSTLVSAHARLERKVDQYPPRPRWYRGRHRRPLLQRTAPAGAGIA